MYDDLVRVPSKGTLLITLVDVLEIRTTLNNKQKQRLKTGSNLSLKKEKELSRIIIRDITSGIHNIYLNELIKLCISDIDYYEKYIKKNIDLKNAPHSEVKKAINEFFISLFLNQILIKLSEWKEPFLNQIVSSVIDPSTKNKLPLRKIFDEIFSFYGLSQKSFSKELYDNDQKLINFDERYKDWTSGRKLPKNETLEKLSCQEIEPKSKLDLTNIKDSTEKRCNISAFIKKRKLDTKKLSVMIDTDEYQIIDYVNNNYIYQEIESNITKNMLRLYRQPSGDQKYFVLFISKVLQKLEFVLKEVSDERDHRKIHDIFNKVIKSYKMINKISNAKWQNMEIKKLNDLFCHNATISPIKERLTKSLLNDSNISKSSIKKDFFELEEILFSSKFAKKSLDSISKTINELLVHCKNKEDYYFLKISDLSILLDRKNTKNKFNKLRIEESLEEIELLKLSVDSRWDYNYYKSLYYTYCGDFKKGLDYSHKAYDLGFGRIGSKIHKIEDELLRLLAITGKENKYNEVYYKSTKYILTNIKSESTFFSERKYFFNKSVFFEGVDKSNFKYGIPYYDIYKTDVKLDYKNPKKIIRNAASIPCSQLMLPQVIRDIKKFKKMYNGGKGADINYRDQDNSTALLKALEFNEFETVEFILRSTNISKETINIKTKDKNITAMSEAIGKGRVNIVKQLLRKKYDLRIRATEDYVEPLYQCINVIATQIYSPYFKEILYYPPNSSIYEIIDEILNHNDRSLIINRKTKLNGFYPLLLAVEIDDHIIIQKLLQKGAKPTLKNSHGLDCFNYARSEVTKETMRKYCK